MLFNDTVLSTEFMQRETDWEDNCESPGIPVSMNLAYRALWRLFVAFLSSCHVDGCKFMNWRLGIRSG